MPINIGNFVFVKNLKINEVKNFHIGIIPKKIKNKKELMEVLYYNLKFPEYFGANWDALDEVLADTDWIRGNLLIIKHLDLPMLNKKDLLVYLEILSDAVEVHKNGPRKEFILPQRKIEMEVIFPIEVRKEIEKLL